MMLSGNLVDVELEDLIQIAELLNKGTQVRKSGETSAGAIATASPGYYNDFVQFLRTLKTFDDAGRNAMIEMI